MPAKALARDLQARRWLPWIPGFRRNDRAAADETSLRGHGGHGSPDARSIDCPEMGANPHIQEMHHEKLCRVRARRRLCLGLATSAMAATGEFDNMCT